VGPRSGLDGRKISPPGFDPGLSSPQSVAIPTELPGPHEGIMGGSKNQVCSFLALELDLGGENVAPANLSPGKNPGAH
jgi:hypothetical protein